MTSLGKSKHTGGSYNYGYYRHQTAGAKPTGNSWYDDPHGHDSIYDDDDYWGYAIGKASDSEKKTDFLGAELKGKAHYYIAYKTTSSLQLHYAYYNGYHYEDYEDDIESFKQYVEDYVLVDYGIVLDDGTLYSDSKAMEPVVDSCALF
jgi:hypothetical protein